MMYYFYLFFTCFARGCKTIIGERRLYCSYYSVVCGHNMTL